MLPQSHEKTNIKNLLIAVVLSAIVLLGFEYIMLKNAQDVTPEETATAALAQKLNAPASNDALQETSAAKENTDALIPFSTETMHGKISLKGGVPTLVSLTKYHAHATDSTEDGTIDLINGAPFTQKLGSFYEAGGLLVPTAQTIWKLVNKGNMTKESPMILAYQNTSGQSFNREIYTEGYVLHVEDTVVNGAEVPVSLQKISAVTRQNGQKENERSSWYNFFGPQGLITGDIITHSFKKLDKNNLTTTGEDGYWGFSEQFFAVMALAPEGVATERKFSAEGSDYIATMKRPVEFVSAGGGANFDAAFYIGPKRIDDLTAAGNLLPTLVDYGWFDFMAKPMFWLMSYFHDNWFANWGWSIVALTMVLKILTYPLAAKSYKSMGKLRKIQPEVKEIQAKYKDGGREQMAGEMMALYKKHGVNPMSGCWPMFIQIPIFFAMYKMVLLTFELRGAEFILWVHDLSIADPYFVLPILMGISMFIQMRLSPSTGDPVQAKVMQFMPVIFTVLFLFFPSGLVLYWLTNNVVSVTQQWWFMKKA